MRLFIGLDLPIEVKQHIYDYLKPIHQSQKGWEKAHDYHQTLLFIGEASEDDLTFIKSRMDSISFLPFQIKPTQFDFFNRRVMYLGFEKSLELMELKVKIDQHFAEWVKPDSKSFIPHVTVKRWQRYEYDHISEGLRRATFEHPPITINCLHLFKSEKDSSDNKYHVIYKRCF